jgi:heat shock protein HslJ
MTRRFARNTTTLLCTLSLAWTACGGSDDKPAATPAEDPAAAARAAKPPPPRAAAAAAPAAATYKPELTQIEWQLVAIEPADGARIEPADDAVPNVRFNSAATAAGVRRVVGFSGCNRFIGDYELGDDGSLGFPKTLAATQMACPEALMGLEASFTKALSEATGYAVEGDQLTITFPDGSLRFGRG